MDITEIKRHLDGRTERFACRLIVCRPHVVVFRFDFDEERRAGGYRFPAGSRSYGFLWLRRPYQLYRMIGPDGRLIAHRFDVVESVRLGETEVSYTDLLLDVWADPNGSLTVEDEDEVKEYIRRGLLSTEQQRRIARTRALLTRRHGAIVREAARLLDEAGER